jgi:hypothetical protein
MQKARRTSPENGEGVCAADGPEGRFSTGAAHRAVAAFANFADSYQIDPDLSIRKCKYRNPT